MVKRDIIKRCICRCCDKIAPVNQAWVCEKCAPESFKLLRVQQ